MARARSSSARSVRGLSNVRRRLRRTKIVATIGPASREPEVLDKMIEAGVDVARLNFSHGTRREHAETIQRSRNAAGGGGRPGAGLQGPPGPQSGGGGPRAGRAAPA